MVQVALAKQLLPLNGPDAPTFREKSGLSSIVGFAAAVAQGPIEDVFSLPSRNIWCDYGLEPRRPVLTCYRSEPKFLAITLAPSGKPKIWRPEGDAGDAEVYDVLEYGQRWARGPFNCSSSEAGLSCDRDNPRHGFFLSRDHVKTY